MCAALFGIIVGVILGKIVLLFGNPLGYIDDKIQEFKNKRNE
jgi:hypothetical protein